MRKSRPFAVLLFSTILLVAAGCTSMQQVDPSQGESLADTIRQDAALLALGDDVEITRRDGRRIKGKVLSVDADTIALEGGLAISINDVAGLRVRKVSPGRTAVAAAGGYVLLMAAVVAGAIATALSGG